MWKRLKRELRRMRARLANELRLVNSPASAWRFFKWLGRAVGRRARTLFRPVRPKAPGSVRDGSAAASVAPGPVNHCLGVEIVALGDRAQSVFAASSRVGRTVGGNRFDIAVVDTAELGQEAARKGIPVVALDEAPPMLSVRAIDPEIDNPIGWVRDVRNTVGALGVNRLLPTVRRADELVRADDREGLRAIYQLEDVQAFHTDVIARAGTLVQLAARGTVVHLTDGGKELKPYLGEELFGLMTREVRNLDIDGREEVSVATRRAALRDHSLKSRARQVAEQVLADPPRLPLVSILMATKRPELLVDALASVRRQTYPRLELILCLHDENFGEVLPGAAGTHVPLTVLRPGPELALGSVLNAAVEASRGTLLTKMDDDDLYGSEHVWDLVLAHEFSRAPLVGKADEFVYLATTNQILRQAEPGAEAYGNTKIAGGALMVERCELERVGGWRRLPGSGTDQALVHDVLLGGGNRIYRTHPRGFLLVRHGKDHTWGIDESWFRTRRWTAVKRPRPGLTGVDEQCLIKLMINEYVTLAKRIHHGIKGTGGSTCSTDFIDDQAERLVNCAPTEMHRAAASELQRALASGAFDNALRMAQTIGRAPDMGADKVVSHKYRLLWICLPKAASTSIKFGLRKLDPEAIFFVNATISEVCTRCPQARDYFSVALVRDPCQRAFSYFAEKIVLSNGIKRRAFIDQYFGKSSNISFGEMCQWLNSPWGSDAFANRHWQSQTPQLMLEDGQMPDFVGRVENIDLDWDTALQRLGMPAFPLPRRNEAAAQEPEEGGRRVEDLPKDELIAQNESVLRARYAEDYAFINQLPGSHGS